MAALRVAFSIAMSGKKNQEAKKYLERIYALKPKTPDEADEARHLLALLLLAENGSYEQKREKLRELGFIDIPTEDAANESAKDKRTRAFIQAAQGRRRDREAAIKTLEDIGKLQPLTSADQFMLAELHEGLGNWSRARNCLMLVLSKEENNPEYVAAFARSLIKRGGADVEEAKDWVEKLEHLQPNVGRTIELRARLLHAEGRSAAAAALVTKYATENKGASLFAVAVFLEEIGQLDAAEKMFVRFKEQSQKPESSLPLAGFLARHGRLADALKLCDQIRSTATLETVIGSAVSLLYMTKSSESDQKLVEGWIKEGLQANGIDVKNRAQFQQSLAAVYHLQGRFQDAEATFRECLKENPQDALSMNNLAWLLATQGQNAEEALHLIEQAINTVGPQDLPPRHSWDRSFGSGQRRPGGEGSRRSGQKQPYGCRPFPPGAGPEIGEENGGLTQSPPGSVETRSQRNRLDPFGAATNSRNYRPDWESSNASGPARCR